MTTYYSAKRNGLYHDAFKEAYDASAFGWPDDAVAVEPGHLEALLAELSTGLVLSAGEDGQPQAVVAVNSIEDVRQAILYYAAQKINPLETELKLDVITVADKKLLTAWIKYRKTVSTLNETPWPVAPDGKDFN